MGGVWKRARVGWVGLGAALRLSVGHGSDLKSRLRIL